MTDTECTVKRIRIQEGFKRRFSLEFTGHEGHWVAMSFSELTSKSKFSYRTLRGIDRIMERPPLATLDRLLQEAERIKSGPPVLQLVVGKQ